MSPDKMYRSSYKLGFIAYTCLIIMAIIFYQERTVFVDIAYHMFHILKDDTFAIQNFRFGAIFTQLIPLVGGKLQLSLDTIMLLYSAGFIVYYFICYAICGSVLKQYGLALVLLLGNILFVTDTFFWIQSELPQGLAFMMVVLSLVNYSKSKPDNPWLLSLVFAGGVTVAFFHPLLLFPLGFIFLYSLLNSELFLNKKLFLSFFIFYLLIVVIKTIAFKTPYDNTAFSGVKNFLTLFPDYFTIDSNKVLLKNFITKYYWIPVVSIWLVVVYVSKKEWLKLGLLVVAVTGYFLLINVSYPSGATDFYIENLYLPIGIMLAVPLVYDIFPVLSFRNKNMPILLIATIITTGLLRIFIHSDPYVARLEWGKGILNKYEGKKVLMHSSEAPMDTLLMTWGTPYEFWLLSTAEKGTSASIAILDDIEGVKWAAGNKQDFITQWGVFNYKDLPKTYFKFSDTTSSYILME